MGTKFYNPVSYLDDNNVVQKLYEKHSHFAFFKIKTNSEFRVLWQKFDQTPSM